jgi:hypothetical protein
LEHFGRFFENSLVALVGDNFRGKNFGAMIKQSWRIFETCKIAEDASSKSQWVLLPIEILSLLRFPFKIKIFLKGLRFPWHCPEEKDVPWWILSMSPGPIL